MNGAPCQHRVLDDPFGQKTCQKSFAQWECCFNNFLLKTQLGHEQIQKMSQMLESFKSNTLLNTGQHTRALATVMWDEPSSKAGPRKSLCNPLYRELLGIVHFISIVAVWKWWMSWWICHPHPASPKTEQVKSLVIFQSLQETTVWLGLCCPLFTVSDVIF